MEIKDLLYLTRNHIATEETIALINVFTFLCKYIY